MYQNLVIQESGDTVGALEHYGKYGDQICDKAALLYSKGKTIIE